MNNLLSILLFCLCESCIVVKPCGCDCKLKETVEIRNAVFGATTTPAIDTTYTMHGYRFKGDVLTDSLLKSDTALQHKLQLYKQVWPEYMTPATHAIEFKHNMKLL